MLDSLSPAEQARLAPLVRLSHTPLLHRMCRARARDHNEPAFSDAVAAKRPLKPATGVGEFDTARSDRDRDVHEQGGRKEGTREALLGGMAVWLHRLPAPRHGTKASP